MPEWLSQSVSPDTSFSTGQLLIRLVIAAVYGGCVAMIYRVSHGRTKSRHEAVALTSTLVLLSILIAMVSMVIGESVARAFSLVGALSIVRFRTVVDDTRDTAFVIFAVIVGMAAGAGLLLVPLIGIPTVAVAAMLLSRPQSLLTPTPLPESTLSLQLGLGRDPEVAFGDVLRRHLSRYRLITTGTCRKGAALDLTYRVQLGPSSGMSALVTELNQVEGVLSVELRSS